jgi:excisionase family DNA binding protein
VRPALPPRLLGLRDAGAYLGVSAWTARQLVERRELRLVKLPGIARWLVDRADLDALIEKAKAAR